MELRPYQKQILDEVRERIKKGHKRILVSAPTGSGKTVLAKKIAEGVVKKGGRFMFTAHRRKLVEQTFDKFWGLDASIVMSQDKRFDLEKPVQIGTLQSIRSKDFLLKPSIIMVDECHYGWTGQMMEDILKRFPESIVIGLSATPCDNNGYLLEGWDTIVNVVQTPDLVEQGYLTPTINYAPVHLDIEDVPLTTYGDYESEALVERLEEQQVKSLPKYYNKFAKGRKALVFCVNINHAIKVCGEFRDAGLFAAPVHSKMPIEVIEDNYRRFDNGDIKILVNVDILTAGYDNPRVDCLILARPTKSKSLYPQIIGRGLRISEGKKNCVIIDCANNIEEHGLPIQTYEWEFKPKFSKTIDRQMNLETAETRAELELSPEREKYLKKIGSLLDLYEGKVYKTEQKLLEDVVNFLSKTKHFFYRQNSGKLKDDKGRWVHFASRAGLPDITVYYYSIYFGIELKLPKGYMTANQQQTIPEMIKKNVLVFIAETVRDIYEILCHMETFIKEDGDNIIINREIYKMPERQEDLRRKHNVSD